MLKEAISYGMQGVVIDLPGIPESNRSLNIKEQQLEHLKTFLAGRSFPEGEKASLETMQLTEEAKIAFDQLPDDYERFINSIANKLTGKGLEKEDVMQEGRLGLMDALPTYDISFGIPFASYAYPRVRGAILDALHKSANSIRIPRRAFETLKLINGKKDEWMKKTGRTPTFAELSKLTGIEIDKITDITRVSQGVLSIDDLHSVRETSDEFVNEFEETFAGDDVPVEEYIEWKEMSDVLRRAWEEMPESRDKDVLVRRFGFGQDVQTQIEIGNAFGVEQSRISQIEKRAIKKLRERAVDLGML
jgi:RNA polymerase primary sigma factor